MNAPDSLRKGLKSSLIAHLALATFVVLKSLIFPGDPVVYTPTLRVDLVALPDILKKDLSKVPPIPPDSEALKKAEEEQPKKPIPIKAEPEDEDPNSLALKKKESAKDHRKKRNKSALDRIKSLSKIQDEDIKPQTPIIKGNKISKGSSLSDDARESEGVSYLDTIRDRLQTNWALPTWLSRQNLSAQVVIFIDRTGRVLSFKFVRASGEAQFDEAVKRTIIESQPFPPPPGDSSSDFLSSGISLGFPL